MPIDNRFQSIPEINARSLSVRTSSSIRDAIVIISFNDFFWLEISARSSGVTLFSKFSSIFSAMSCAVMRGLKRYVSGKKNPSKFLTLTIPDSSQGNGKLNSLALQFSSTAAFLKESSFSMTPARNNRTAISSTVKPSGIVTSLSRCGGALAVNTSEILQADSAPDKRKSPAFIALALPCVMSSTRNINALRTIPCDSSVYAISDTDSPCAMVKFFSGDNASAGESKNQKTPPNTNGTHNTITMTTSNNLRKTDFFFLKTGGGNTTDAAPKGLPRI